MEKQWFFSSFNRVYHGLNFSAGRSAVRVNRHIEESQIKLLAQLDLKEVLRLPYLCA